MSTTVSADNFVRAETDRMLADIQRDAGGVNLLAHHRVPTPIDQQTVIRLNRDTLYSFAVVDVSQGAKITVPDSAGRYLSVMLVNRDHLVTDIFHDAGVYDISADTVGSDYVLVGVRTLVNPNDPADIAAVSVLQDKLGIEAGSAVPFDYPDYDTASMDRTRAALLELAAVLPNLDHMFGTAEQVQPIRHLIGTAAGWGGLPATEATYMGTEAPAGADRFEMIMKDVPVDAFWSISIYDAQGFFVPNPENRYSVNSITGIPNEDGSITVGFVAAGGELTGPNDVPTPGARWGYIVRLYRPRAEILDGTWTLPPLTPVG